MLETQYSMLTAETSARETCQRNDTGIIGVRVEG